MNLKSIIIRAVSIVSACTCICSAVSAQNLGLKTVVIDPGHGGKDPGAISSDKKTQEKDLVLDISSKLKKSIEDAYPDVKVYMTRDDDTFVELNNRAKFATNKGAALFISVHINSADAKKTGPNGYSVHLLGPSTDKTKDTYAFNMDVVKKENGVILLEEDYSTTYQGFDPNDPESDIFLRLMANSYREQSLLFAQAVNDRMKSGPFAKSNGIYQNNFAVLRLASMPAVLLELGFISNPNDLAQLRKSSSIDRIVKNVFEAFCDYKTIYDESVGAKVVKPKVSAPAPKESVKESQESTAAEENTKEENTGKEETGTIYATQVLASAKLMDPKDKYFLGYEYKVIRTATLYKYFIGVSTDPEEARTMCKEIRKKYPDSFLVKIEGDVSTRLKM